MLLNLSASGELSSKDQSNKGCEDQESIQSNTAPQKYDLSPSLSLSISLLRNIFDLLTLYSYLYFVMPSSYSSHASLNSSCPSSCFLSIRDLFFLCLLPSVYALSLWHQLLSTLSLSFSFLYDLFLWHPLLFVFFLLFLFPCLLSYSLILSSLL